MRNPVAILLPALLFAGLLLFVCRLGARRQIQHLLRGKASSAAKFEALFQVATCPHGDTVKAAFSRLSPAELQAVVTGMPVTLIRRKVLSATRLLDHYYLIAIDGTGGLVFAERHCTPCLPRTQHGVTPYYHPLLEAKFVTTTVVIIIAAWGSSCRYPLVPLIVLGTVASWLLLSDLIVRNYRWFYLLQHAGYNTGLAILVGRTLLGERTPLVTRFAAIVHDEMPPELIRYSRQVTHAWTLFFIGVTLISIGLFVFTPIETWSLFANILYLPLVLLMFIDEYLVRLRRLPHIKQVSFMETLRSGSRYFREKRAANRQA